jgi:hypothetical protein
MPAALIQLSKAEYCIEVEAALVVAKGRGRSDGGGQTGRGNIGDVSLRQIRVKRFEQSVDQILCRAESREFFPEGSQFPGDRS